MSNASRSTVAILGVPFHNVTMDETVTFIEDRIRQGGFHQIATANVDFLRNALHDKDLRNILCSCDMVVPDGMPIVWMSQLLGTALKERVSGIDLVERLAEVSARRGYGLFLLGASETHSARAAKALRQRYPQLRIVGRYSPEPQPLGKMDHEEILRRIEEARPDILLVAFGNPKQEEWIAMHRNRLQVPVCIGVGGTIDFLSGTVARAPRWMQRSGMEWAHRTVQEPNRLLVRYSADALCLMRYLPAYFAASVAQPRELSSSSVLTRQVGNTKLIAVMGNLRGTLLEDFDTCSGSAYKEGMNIVVDFSRTSSLGPEALGTLIRLESRMRLRREQLWLAEVPAHLARILRTGQLHNYFMTTTMVSDALYRTAKAEQKLLASITPAWGQASSKLSSMDVRMEPLQDVCRRILAKNKPEESTLAPAVLAGAGR